MITNHLTCWSCGYVSERKVPDLGLQPWANNLLAVPPEEIMEELRFPLIVDVCNNCFLKQLKDLFPPVRLFSEYIYNSSFSNVMLRDARETVESYASAYFRGNQVLAPEIAGYEGFLNQYFQATDIHSLGIEHRQGGAGKGDRNQAGILLQGLGRRLGGWGDIADPKSQLVL